jgi:DNA-binding CsgD family transcriptional regulator
MEAAHSIGVDFVRSSLRIDHLADGATAGMRRPMATNQFALSLADEAAATMTQAHHHGEPKSGIDPLLYQIHAWADANGDWGDVLALLRERLDGRLATLARHHFVSGHGQVICEDPASPAYRAVYAKYASRNPWFLSSVEYTASRVLTGEELLSNRDLVRTDYFRALLEPQKLLHYIAGVAVRRGPLMYYVSVHRGPDQTPFGERERSILRTVIAHVSLALANRWRLRETSDLTKVMMGVVDRYPHPCLLIDADGRLVHGNRSAGVHSMPSIGLCIEGGRLEAALPIDRPALCQAIHDVALSAARGTTDSTRAVTLSVPGGNHPAVVSVHAAGSVFDAGSGDVTELVLVTARNPGLAHDVQTCSFVKQFGLSPAQARVGVMIITGHSLVETARRLHVSDNTVRSHLKQIFQKSETHGQMELVHLHARICASTD